MSWESDLQDWGDTRTADAPSTAEADALVARAAARTSARSRPSARRIVVATTLAVAAATLLAVRFQPQTGVTGWTWTPPQRIAAVEPVAAEPAPLPAGTHQLHDDELEVQTGATVVALSTGPTTRLRLDAGAVTAKVSHRTGTEQFSIETASHTVTVVGTEFSVQQQPFAVRVTRGTVVVERVDDGTRWNVTAGESFVEGRVQRPAASKPAPPPSLTVLQKMVIDGELAQARDGLNQRLRDDPADAASWRLLAQLEERSDDRDAAVEAWMTVIRVGSNPHAQGARYEAARLLSDTPERVIPLLTEFLKAEHPLSGEARLRLADAYEAANQPDQAQKTLAEAARLHAGTSVGRKAKRRLR